MSHESFAALTATVLLVAYFLYQRPHLREERAWNESALLRYSLLHLFTSTLNELGKPEEMAEKMLDRTLKALNSEVGCFLLATPAPENVRYLSGRGISSSTLAQLSGEPLFTYLLRNGKGSADGVRQLARGSIDSWPRA